MAKPKAYFESDPGFWGSHGRLVVDGKDLKPGFFGLKGISESMAADPLAKALAEDFECYQSWSLGLIFGGLIAALTYMAVSLGNDNYDSDTYWGVFALAFIPGSIMGGAARAKLNRSINQYNGVYSETSSWRFAPVKNGLGLAYTF